MMSGILSSVVCLLYATLIPTVSAYNFCTAHTDADSIYHDAQECGPQFCCGDCNKIYCCSDAEVRLSEDEQEQCFHSFDQPRSSSGLRKLASIVGTIIGSVVTIIIACVALIICCVVPCCCCYKKCRERRGGSQPVVNTHRVIDTPQQPPAFPASLGSYQQGGQYPGYQAVPTQLGYGTQHLGYEGQPMPEAPPTYAEVSGPDYPHAPMPYSQAAFIPGQPLYPLQPSAQPNAPSPPQSDYLPQPAYNPSYAEGPKH